MTYEKIFTILTEKQEKIIFMHMVVFFSIFVGGMGAAISKGRYHKGLGLGIGLVGLLYSEYNERYIYNTRIKKHEYSVHLTHALQEYQ